MKPQILLDRIAHKVRFHRRYRGWTLLHLATAAGLSQGHLSEIEHGKKNVSVQTLNKLAMALHVRICHLVP